MQRDMTSKETEIYTMLDMVEIILDQVTNEAKTVIKSRDTDHYLGFALCLPDELESPSLAVSYVKTELMKGNLFGEVAHATDE